MMTLDQIKLLSYDDQIKILDAAKSGVKEAMQLAVRLSIWFKIDQLQADQALLIAAQNDKNQIERLKNLPSEKLKIEAEKVKEKIYHDILKQIKFERLEK